MKHRKKKRIIKDSVFSEWTLSYQGGTGTGPLIFRTELLFPELKNAILSHVLWFAHSQEPNPRSRSLPPHQVGLGAESQG